jgi:hypothetical protein
MGTKHGKWQTTETEANPKETVTIAEYQEVPNEEAPLGYWELALGQTAVPSYPSYAA